MTTYYIIDTRTDRIINAVETSKRNGPSLNGFYNREFLKATTTPTSSQLRDYRYWSERP